MMSSQELNCDPDTGVCALPRPNSVSPTGRSARAARSPIRGGAAVADSSVVAGGDEGDVEEGGFNGMLSGFEGHLLNENGDPVDSSVFKGKLVGVYFGGSWNETCKEFTPVLAAFQEKHKEEFVVIYVSYDHSEETMVQFVDGKGFLRLPWKGGHNKRIAEEFENMQLPALLIMNPQDGQQISDWGRMSIVKNEANCLKEWQEGWPGVSYLQLGMWWR